eukprot:TRINITY_DN11614_c0_g1_i1.p1 TRINITY_DN11614_c0_g1~~TRINITY_DN11614_c0_g1_i1.p1  ORF type:complete len:425 (+),score=35.47 TRINITY_DN11614_c0_g1_i1:50-1324(+)
MRRVLSRSPKRCPSAVVSPRRAFLLLSGLLFLLLFTRYVSVSDHLHSAGTWIRRRLGWEKDVMAECSQRLSSALAQSKVPSNTKDIFSLLLATLSDRSKEQYFDWMTSQPYRITHSYQIEQILKNKDEFPCSTPGRLKVALCAMQSSMGPFMQEWIMHYVILGVQKIFIISNNDAWPEYAQGALEPFIGAGVVEIYPPNNNGYPQTEFYQICHKENAKNFDWIGNFDLDEYLMPYRPFMESYQSSKIGELICIPDFLRNYEQFGGVVAPWRRMHSSGVPRHNFSMLFFEQYKFFSNETYPLVKTFYNTKYGGWPTHQHKGTFVDSRPVVNPAGREEMLKEDHVIRNDTSAYHYEHMELRHFWGSSWISDIYVKLCGDTPERKFFMDVRAQQFFDSFAVTSDSQVTVLPNAYLKKLRRALRMPPS